MYEIIIGTNQQKIFLQKIQDSFASERQKNFVRYRRVTSPVSIIEWLYVEDASSYSV